jgi:hypothetical protein
MEVSKNEEKFSSYDQSIDDIRLTIGDLTDGRVAVLEESINGMSSIVSKKDSSGKFLIESMILQNKGNLYLAADRLILTNSSSVKYDENKNIVIKTGQGMTIDSDGVLNVGELNADWIKTGTLNAGRVNIGTEFSVSANGELIISEIDANKITTGSITLTSDLDIVFSSSGWIMSDYNNINGNKGLTIMDGNSSVFALFVSPSGSSSQISGVEISTIKDGISTQMSSANGRIVVKGLMIDESGYTGNARPGQIAFRNDHFYGLRSSGWYRLDNDLME